MARNSIFTFYGAFPCAKIRRFRSGRSCRHIDAH